MSAPSQAVRINLRPVVLGFMSSPESQGAMPGSGCTSGNGGRRYSRGNACKSWLRPPVLRDLLCNADPVLPAGGTRCGPAHSGRDRQTGREIVGQGGDGVVGQESDSG